MDTARSLFGHAASLPWLLFLWSAAEILERFEFIAHKMHDARELVMTPWGGVVLLIVSVVWLTLIPMWPSIRKRFPNLPDPLHVRVRAVENAAAQDRSAHLQSHRGLEERISVTDTKLKSVEDTQGKHESFHVAIQKRIEQSEVNTAEQLESLETLKNALTGPSGSIATLFGDLREMKHNIGVEFDKSRPLITPEVPPDCLGIIYRRRWNKEEMWVADVQNMMDATLTNTSARIRFVSSGREITRPNSSWIVEQHRGPGGDRMHVKQADSVTLAMGERYPFEFVLSNANGGGTYCATRTVDLTEGDWEAQISLISGSYTVEGVVKFTIFPDNDLSWESRKFVLRRKSNG